MNLVNVLSEKELKMIDEYVDMYGLEVGDDGDRSMRFNCGAKADIAERLCVWGQNKKWLYHLFGNQLRIEKNISIRASDYAPNNLVDELRDSDFYWELYRAQRNNGWVQKKIQVSHLKSNWAWAPDLTTALFEDNENIIHNVYHGPNLVVTSLVSDAKPITITEGTKLMKVCGKLAKMIGKEDSFENFRIMHSKLNDYHKIDGTLVLSIHPIDYLTMSDNNYDWDSCMSWRNGGCYRRGTVEMMNSKSAIVAYWKGKDFYPAGHYYDPIPDKKWRTLVLATNDFLATIKAYPYRHDEAAMELISWLKDLGLKNLGIEYGETIGSSKNHFSWNENDFITFNTDTMYNDFGCSTMHFFARNVNAEVPENVYTRRYKNPDNIDSDVCNYQYNYSGEDVCMYCGRITSDYYSTSDVYCTECTEDDSRGEYIGCCTNCDEEVYDGDEYYSMVDGTVMCGNCGDQEARLCNCCNEWEYRGRALPIKLSYKGHECSEPTTHLCRYCSKEFDDIRPFFTFENPEDEDRDEDQWGPFVRKLVIEDQEEEKLKDIFHALGINTKPDIAGRTAYYMSSKDEGKYYKLIDEDERFSSLYRPSWFANSIASVS